MELARKLAEPIRRWPWDWWGMFPWILFAVSVVALVGLLVAVGVLVAQYS